MTNDDKNTLKVEMIRRIVNSFFKSLPKNKSGYYYLDGDYASDADRTLKNIQEIVYEEKL